MNPAETISFAPIQSINIDQLYLDKNNIRLRHKKKPDKDLTQDETSRGLQEIGNVSELVKEIIEAGIVYEAIVVNSENVVIEGNRRLLALRCICNEINEGKHSNLDLKKFSFAQCRVIPKGVPQNEIDLYLTSIHVRAKKPWRLFNRASHIHTLSKKWHYSYNKISAHVGMSKETVQRSMTCYGLIIEYSRLYPKDIHWSTKYSYYEELFKKVSLTEFRANKNNIIKFHKWVYEDRFNDALSVRQLPKIMDDSDAFRQFEKSGMVQALMVLSKEDPSINNKDFKRVKQTISSLKGLSRTELSEIRNSSSKMRYLYTLKNEIELLMSELENVQKRNVSH